MNECGERTGVLQAHPVGLLPSDLIDGLIEFVESIPRDEKRGAHNHPLMRRRPDLGLLGQRLEALEHLSRIVHPHVLDRRDDHFAHAYPVEVGRVGRRTAHPVPKARDLRVLRDDLPHQAPLFVHRAHAKLDLSVELLELGLQLLAVRFEDPGANRSLVLHHHAEAHREDDPVLQRLLEHPGVRGQLLPPELQLLGGGREVADQRRQTAALDLVQLGAADAGAADALGRWLTDAVDVRRL